MNFKQSKSIKMSKHNNYIQEEEENSKVIKHPDKAKEIVLDYLTTHGYQKSLQIFKVESLKSQKNDSITHQKMLRLLTSNNRNQFFNKLKTEIPKEVRQNNQTYRKLEFFLHIYFVITTKKQKSFDLGAMQAFRTLLETKGKYLSENKQFLPYFALPYIQDPSCHPATIAHIFKKDWLAGVRNELVSFLEQVWKQPKKSKLEILLNKQHSKQNTASFQQFQPSRQKELMNIITQSNQHYTQLQQNYKQMIEAVKENLIQSQGKWFNLAKQLIMITKKFIRVAEQNNLISGQMGNMVQKIKKYEVFLNSNVDDVISNSVSMSVFDQPTYDDLASQSVSRNIIKRKTSINMLSLNYLKMKHTMLEDTDLNICLLLQALRWRVTKTSSALGRRQIIMGYTINDIFSLKTEGSYLLKRLLGSDTSQIIKQHTLRLINTIQSDYYGRSYMLQNNFILQRLVQTLKSESYDGTIRRLALNALQKLSLRPKAQLYTIQQGIIHWIVKTIKLQKQQLSETSFQYLAALLMNMTLKKAGQEQCQKQHMLQLLIDLLQINQDEIRTYISGSIYSLLSCKKLKQEAKQIGMLQQLRQYQSKDNSAQFSKQISYIINQLQKNQTDKESIVNDEDEENDVDDLQQQEDDNSQQDFEDQIEGAQRMDKGEQLLLKRYSCVGPEAIRQQYLTRSILDDTIIKNSIDVSIIKQKRSNQEENRSSIPIRSTLQLLQAIDARPKKQLRQNNEQLFHLTIQQQKSIPKDYDSNNYVPKYKNFRKKNLIKSSLVSDESIKSPQPLKSHK